MLIAASCYWYGLCVLTLALVRLLMMILFSHFKTISFNLFFSVANLADLNDNRLSSLYETSFCCFFSFFSRVHTVLIPTFRCYVALFVIYFFTFAKSYAFLFFRFMLSILNFNFNTKIKRWESQLRWVCGIYFSGSNLHASTSIFVNLCYKLFSVRNCGAGRTQHDTHFAYKHWITQEYTNSVDIKPKKENSPLTVSDLLE